MALVLPIHENEGKDKHVESVWLPRLDEGSIPSSSTQKRQIVSVTICRFFCVEPGLLLLVSMSRISKEGRSMVSKVKARRYPSIEGAIFFIGTCI